MSPNVRLSLKLTTVAILSGVWVIIIFVHLFNWIESKLILLLACASVVFPITISILICRTDAVLKRIPLGVRIFGLAIFSIVSGFLLLCLFLIFVSWIESYI